MIGETMSFLVMYSKLSNVKRKKSTVFRGPFIGGIIKNKQEAERLIRRIISEQKGFAILPKTFPMIDGFQDAYDEAQKEFNLMKQEIVEADQIMHRNDKP